MSRVFMRSTSSNGHVHCSWYDLNGRRWRKEVATHSYQGMTIRQTDDKYGFKPYAESNGYTIIDDAPMPHPPRVTE